MYTTIHKWGNSKAVRLPKGILEKASLRENDQVEIMAEHDCIIIRRAKKKHLTIEERFEGYSGNYQCKELDTGKPVGKEVW
ncbi:AbrB/MazE/SpoVT family DNA-binding domain-containing protein [Phosphitispora sp. TUW77]|uniref:AbrB/MazE/SpoVT family DNA-binding domain-containing protein n=1 Tax=Phosphitispora sp. TUW77 TaxID=3152361 RepID=UPI003AB449A7